MSKPSICFIGMGNLPVFAHEYKHHGVGGESVQHTLLAKAMLRRGYDVSMVVQDYGQADGAVWDGIKVYKAAHATAGIPVIRFIHPRWTGLIRAARRANADFYYVSCGGAPLGQMMFHLHGSKHRVIFRIAHDGDCLKDDKERIALWRDRRLYEYGLRRANHILAQTVFQQHELRKNFGLESEVAGMLVQAAERNLSFGERDIPVLWVNNIRPFKRPDLCIELASKVSDIPVHMIGGPMVGYAELFQQITTESARVPNLKFYGQIPYLDINDLYERTRVFVNTSDSEGFPNSYLQAWARGTPVVAFFDPDNVIAREGLGRTVKTMPEMIQAVRELTSDEAAWKEVSARCKSFMAREFSEDKILSPYLAAMER